jgi:GTPase SAR1 family protein
MSLYYGQLVVGPAGGGKSTYCQHVQEMAASLRRNVLVFNLDPAAEHLGYRCDFDIRELITLEDVMEEMGLGPNGGLVYCYEYLLQHREWLEELLAGVSQDDYVLFDCPGQIELYSHLPVFQELTRMLTRGGFALLAVYLLDVSFAGSEDRLLSGLLQALAAVVALELPAMTVLSKCDLAQDE